MHVICPSCRQTLEFFGSRPKYCGQCGQSLGDSQPAVAIADVAETVAPRPTPFLESQTLSFMAPPDGAAEETAASSPSAVKDEAVPEAIGPYRVVRRLGGGGMGTVYEATDPISGRSVALKLVQPEHAASGEALERFRQEGELASRLAHPRCVFVLAAGEDSGRPFIIMELMTGSTLADVVKKGGPLPVSEALSKLLDVIDGLSEAHQLGLVHRDVKPSNCFLEADGRVKIGDFGLAKSLERQADLTRTGTFLGTPLYAAPEQIKMEKVDAVSDVYSVAATLYFLLTGQAPFQSRDPLATMARIVSDDPPPMRTLRPELPKALDQVVLRGLERDRKRRWRSLEEFRKALRPFLPTEPSVGGLGLRVAAYLLDALMLTVVNIGWVMLLGIGLLEMADPTMMGSATRRLLLTIVGEVPALLYFGLLEGLWGRSLGKALFRLRVGTVASARPPGIARALLRPAVLFFLFNLVPLLAVPFLPQMQQASQQPAPPTTEPPKSPLGNMSFIFIVLWPYIALALMLCTMRKRSGYRGLHEVLSGTRTYQLRRPRIKKRRALEAPEFQFAVSRSAGIPETVGPYGIRGALRWTSDQQTLLGDDDKLGRAVWIWIRPATEPALPEAERTIGRTTRMRWVSCGTLPGQQWDAFLAPAGCPLTAVVANGRRLSWAEFRGVLEELTEELRASCAEGSLPDTLAPDQVWVGRGGRMQLLAVPFANVARAEPQPNNADVGQPTDQQRALAFISDVSHIALEGRSRPDGEPPSCIQAPLPVYASRLLNRLSPQPADLNSATRKQTVRVGQPYERIEDFQTDLLATQTEPAEVNRDMRGKHLIYHAVFAWLGISIFGFAPFWLLSREESNGEVVIIGLVLYLILFFLPSFLTRGGLSFMLAGIAVIRPDGRRASRLRCLWRAVLAWTLFALVVGLVVLSVAGITLCSPWISPILGEYGPLICEIVVGVACFAGLATLLLRNPARAPHDFLARTRLVPK
jgi:eukaryotic-like serine/threonine-protein kinase